jgi:adenylate kinase
MKTSKDLKVIIVLGPPGSGKGTQGELLARKLDLYHFETSAVIERNLENIKKNDFVAIGGKKYFLSEEKKLRNSGKWMSPPLIAFWVKSRIKTLAKEGEGMVISGSPKTLFEAKEMTPLLKKLYGTSNIEVILLKQRPEISIWRNQRRKVCQLERHSILYTKEASKLRTCPLDGSKLMRREDNDPKIIKMKLKEYKERTLPLISYLRKAGLKIKEVNGEKSVIYVFKDILKAIK